MFAGINFHATLVLYGLIKFISGWLCAREPASVYWKKVDTGLEADGAAENKKNGQPRGIDWKVPTFPAIEIVREGVHFPVAKGLNHS